LRVLQRNYYEAPGPRRQEKIRFKAQRFFRYLSYTLLILFLVLFYLWQHLRIKELGYQLGEEEKKNRALLARNQELEIRVSSLRSLDRIEEIARSELGFKSPEGSKIILLDISPVKELAAPARTRGSDTSGSFSSFLKSLLTLRRS
jgi:cell division protein FtsL